MSYVCIEIDWKSCSCIVPDKKVRNIIFIEEACSWYSEALSFQSSHETDQTVKPPTVLHHASRLQFQTAQAPSHPSWCILLERSPKSQIVSPVLPLTAWKTPALPEIKQSRTPSVSRSPLQFTP
ncbi:hypothetical protein P5673_001396 [Acropora cervicornis]|uniref:Uncharacterized protein n=1 Tax=Acropora cervicornis TaxID=6130 RepID=A0AAD9VH37_ACRCE|nr:hypothetical protein P5673_001396 [Acropora cervicornis]